ncbi:lipopolysaccharide biosynthesis protein [Porphyromonas levii]|uniref:lipopolysaccharide biosynthesis protein n=1 Tax=Porphyromonas levii TaxID=28114 RepID=UPI001B7FA4F9|nr:lipopolysaccharide biosynthesis protein [Porphyromonas levii]
MIFVLGVALYTSRVLLDVLGVEDYGVYNVVGGVVTMLGFFNGAMVSSTQRFFSYAIGKNDFQQLSQNYSTILVIQGGLALLILLLAETVGLWFVNTHLVIPSERMYAAQWVFHLAVLTFVLSMMQVPFTAMIITHERMNAYAYISIADVLLKLIAVIVIPWVTYDKLIIYALFLFGIALFSFLAYVLYTRMQFKYVQYVKEKNKALFKTLLSYMGWNLWGNAAAVIMNQGVNILINLFFGPAVNAARAVAYQVQSAVNQLVSNFQLAMNPQIVKSYAAGDMTYMHNLVIRGAKLSFCLVFVFAVPVIIECETLLNIWLSKVPEHAVLFTQLIMVFIVLESLSGTMMISIQATGDIGLYQTVVGGLLILNLPISYLFLKNGANPEVTVLVSIIISFIAFVLRIFIVAPKIDISRRKLFGELFLRLILVGILTLTISYFIRSIGFEKWMSLFITFFSSVLFTSVFMYIFGFSKVERQFIVSYIHKNIRKNE